MTPPNVFLIRCQVVSNGNGKRQCEILITLTFLIVRKSDVEDDDVEIEKEVSDMEENVGS